MQTYRRIFGSLGGGALLLAGLFFFAVHTGQAVQAAGGAFFVSPGGAGDCSQAAPCDLSAALAQAGDGDSLYLAAGTYTGSGGAVITVTRSLTLAGGWDGAPAGTVQRDPETYSSVVDGENARRGVFVSGGITVTLDGLQITRGNATGLSGAAQGDEDSGGGGVYVYTSTLTVNDCNIYSNIASLTSTSSGYGGGIYARDSRLTLTASTVQSNTAGVGGKYTNNYGGGIALEYSPRALLRDNLILGNRATPDCGDMSKGGGVAFLYSDYARILTNTIRENTACAGSRTGSGGGMSFWHSGHATIQGNTFEANIATTGDGGDGGGLSIEYSPWVTVTNNTFLGNIAAQMSGSTGYGGGLSAYSPHLWLEGNTFQSNIGGAGCEGEGGGANVSGDDAVIRDNRFVDNLASQDDYGYGGALEVQGDRNTIADNLFRGNTASRNGEGYGGGLMLSWVETSTVSGNLFLGNTATLSLTAVGEGGGLTLHSVHAVTFTNNLVVGNQANTQGSGIFFWGHKGKPTDAVWLHTTIADNRGGAGVYLSPYGTLTFTNTILSGHAVGITVTLGSTATLNATLWDNDADWGGGGTILTGTHNLWGDPRFADPAGWDYHLKGASPAVDAGLDVGVATDMDGESRPQGLAPDLGADEFWPRLYLPLLMKP